MAKIAVEKISCKNFRCFAKKDFEFSSPLVLITGNNGAGKTSLLEALYFSALARSFKTSCPREIATFAQSNFFIKLEFCSSETLQVGFSEAKKRIRFNNSLISNYQQLSSIYQAVALTQDDLGIIQESPEYRRVFLDQILCQVYPETVQLFQKFRSTLSKKSEWLATRKSYDKVLYELLSEEFNLYSEAIKEYRRKLLTEIELVIAPLQGKLFSISSIFKFSYREKFISKDKLTDCELQQGRVLVGAHLDDCLITINDINIRLFGSRGQQKAALFSLKIAHLLLLLKTNETSRKVFIVDDFLSELDEATASFFVDFLLTLEAQFFFTAPIIYDKLPRALCEGQVFNL